jgi:hypothetical protein
MIVVTPLPLAKVCLGARSLLLVSLAVMILFSSASGQKKSTIRQAQKKQNQATAQLAKLRDDYIKATKDYKSSLEKLLPLYEASLRRAEERLAQSKELFKQGLIARKDLDDSTRAVTEARAKVDEVRKQMGTADTQIAQVLVEMQTEKQMKGARIPKGGLVATTAYIRYNGVGAWALSEAGKVQDFFQQRFGRPLPIAVLGQGTIHNQWHLDHRNAMDVSLYPDSAEGQALMDYLRSNGIPFSAFRQAIPGTATGPHIHIGKPSHRY